MTGKHARVAAPRSRAAIAATAAVGVALAIGGVIGGVHLATDGATETATPASAISDVATSTTASESSAATSTGTPSASATPSASEPTRRPQHVSRGFTRQAPSPTATKAVSTAKKTTKPSPKVVDSGSCGASYYDQGQTTANGEPFDPDALTAASKTLAFNTRVRVTNPDNGKSVVVRINDRGPYVDGRCLDLSRAAFESIASLGQGELTVHYEILD